MKLKFLTTFLLAIVVSSPVFSQFSQDLKLSAAKAYAEQVRAEAKALHEDSQRRHEQHKQNDPTWVMRMDISRKILSNPSIQERYIRHLASAIWKCYENGDKRHEEYGTEKYNRIKIKLMEHISGGEPLATIFASGTSAYKESIEKRADWLTTWNSLESLNYAAQMLDKPEAMPIVIAWAAANFNLNLSCIGKANEWETTPADRVYMEIKRALNF